ncbi:MAG: enoyl-CoA hydratase/isomerase family protein [Actinomycetota bacterium]|nr:enoyl-CoA hydratase/isomerase family protein [Actinomycetota bacterium]
MPVEYRKNGHVATFTIANGSVNPFTPAMHRQLYEALVDFESDPDLRVGILTGAGERAFSAGDDIKSPNLEFESPLEELLDELVPSHRVHASQPERYAWAHEVERLERHKPIIGAVNGWCLGQGMVYLLLLTEIRIASHDARFGFPEVAYGMGGAGGATRLGRHIPHVWAMWMLLTGEPIDATEALRINLVNKVVFVADVAAEAEAIAALIARHPPLGVQIEMESYSRGMDLSRLDALRVALDLYRVQRLAIGGDEIVDSFLYSGPKDDT